MTGACSCDEWCCVRLCLKDELVALQGDGKVVSSNDMVSSDDVVKVDRDLLFSSSSKTE